MLRFSLFGFFRICLIGTTLFIIVTHVKETRRRVHRSTVATEQTPATTRFSINNLYWQTLTKDNVSFYFFNAYYDKRYNSRVPPAIRVIAMVDVQEPPQLYCKIWISSERHVIVKVRSYHCIWFKHLILTTELRPFLVTCPIPRTVSKLVPLYLSLITRKETSEQATNLLHVIYNNPTKRKKKFAVCVKGLDFPEDRNGASARLVEWLETQWLLGVHQVVFYVLQIHPNFRTVLEHYKSQDRVQMIPLTLPANQPNEPKAQHDFLAKHQHEKRLNELVPYNDCFYRNLYLYEYIALLDVDEVILPLGAGSTWSQMLKNVMPKAQKLCNKKRGIASYMAENVYLMDDLLPKNHDWFEDIPRYMHMLQHVYRTANYTKGLFRKGLHNTDNVLTVHNHLPFECLNGVCEVYHMLPEDALLYHYRTYCVADFEKELCEALRKNVIRDTRMWRYRDILIERTTKTLVALGLLDKNNTQAAVT